jgi:adenine phosphoribosyltransferase
MASAKLVELVGGEVHGFAFLAELAFLSGRARLGDYDVLALITYD